LATQPVRSEQFACRVCTESVECDIFTLKEMMYGTHEPFDYARCGKCGCLQIQEIPSDLARHYPSNYYSQQPRAEPAMPTGLKRFLMRWYCRSAVLHPDAPLHRTIRRLLPMPMDFVTIGQYLLEGHLRSATDRILDVGSGASPYRLAAMRRCGFAAVEGIDPYLAADCVYEGVPVYRRVIEDVEGEFGMVMFHHSLEHVPDPVATLTHAARLLRSGGTCLVRVPVMNTHFWRRFGGNWVELDAPRHLHLFAVETMEILARCAGFRVRKTVFDSERWEITSSIQYEHGIPLRNAIGDKQFTASELQGYAQEVAELNARSDAGRACFYLERI
jgi:SAM-dependent methyltransferase